MKSHSKLNAFDAYYIGGGVVIGNGSRRFETVFWANKAFCLCIGRLASFGLRWMC